MNDNMPEELPRNFPFGPYVIRECVGRGGMAHVYSAEHVDLRKPVALKVLDRWVHDEPSGTPRFRREARVAAAIKHPNVVDIVDVGVWRGRRYIVMELLKGRDLQAELDSRGALPDAEVVALALPVIAGMMAVHEAGVVHRDIKPSNIFLCTGANGEVVPKVLDFGISKFSDTLSEPLPNPTKTREIIGTPNYMAPEALNGARMLGPLADQYSLGAVLYECAVGRPPFEGQALLEVLKEIALGILPEPRSLRPEISVELESAILRTMDSTPANRFESLRELGCALWPLADERTKTIWAPSFCPPPSEALMKLTDDDLADDDLLLSDEPRRFGRKRRWLWGVPAACAAVFAAWWAGALPPWEGEAAVEGAPVAVVAPSVNRQALLGEPRAGEEPTVERASDSSDGRTATAPVADKASAPARRVGSQATKVRAALRGVRVTRSRPRRTPPTVAPRRDVASANAIANSSTALDTRRDDPMDPDLAELFTSPPQAEAASSEQTTRGDSELSGLFSPEVAAPVGVNGSPLLD